MAGAVKWMEAARCPGFSGSHYTYHAARPVAARALHTRWRRPRSSARRSHPGLPCGVGAGDQDTAQTAAGINLGLTLTRPRRGNALLEPHPTSTHRADGPLRVLNCSRPVRAAHPSARVASCLGRTGSDDRGATRGWSARLGRSAPPPQVDQQRASKPVGAAKTGLTDALEPVRAPTAASR